VKNLKIDRPAFNMIELIIVMVVLGIISSISASLIAKVYESYIIQRAMHRASVSTELVSTQITNRLTYAIGNSIIARKDSTNIRSIQNLNLSSADVQKFNILEWIGYDNDSFSATMQPGWSSYCDVNRMGTTTTEIFTPGSNMEDTNSTTTIIANLGRVGEKNSTIRDGAIIFSGGEYSNYQLYDASCMGFTNTQCISQISSVTDDTITFTDNTNANHKRVLTDRYRLAWSAYAIVPENVDTKGTTDKGDDTYDLILYSNYQPWDGERYTNGDANILATNVTQFKFYGQGSVVRFKICIREEMGLDLSKDSDNLGICKEKVVIK
jgi:prepilin-type N-terminal cleavage/methylation domain-containing protein